MLFIILIKMVRIMLRIMTMMMIMKMMMMMMRRRRMIMTMLMMMMIFFELNTVIGDETGLASQLISTHSLPTQPLKVVPHYQGLRPLLFSNSSVGSFTSHKNQTSERAVRRSLRFFVFIRED